MESSRDETTRWSADMDSFSIIFDNFHLFHIFESYVSKVVARNRDLTDYWINYIIPQIDSTSKYELINIIKTKGIPDAVRSRAWPILLGNSLKISPDIFTVSNISLDYFKSNNKDSLDQLQKPKEGKLYGKEASIISISHDLARTQTDNRDDLRKDKIRHVLEVYTFYRIDIGYVQGMNYVVNTLLDYLDVYNSFQVFCNLCQIKLYKIFIKFQFDEIMKFFDLFNSILNIYEPEIHRYFMNLNVTPDLYLLEWFITLFSRNIRPPTIYHLYDLLFVEKDIFMIKCSLAILHCLKEVILTCSFEQILSLLKELPSVCTSNLIPTIYSNKFKDVQKYLPDYFL